MGDLDYIRNQFSFIFSLYAVHEKNPRGVQGDWLGTTRAALRRIRASLEELSWNESTPLASSLGTAGAQYCLLDSAVCELEFEGGGPIEEKLDIRRLKADAPQTAYELLRAHGRALGRRDAFSAVRRDFYDLYR